MEFSALDWFILVALTGGLIRGFMVGAIRQVASLAGLLVSFFMAVQFMGPTGDLVVQSLGLAAQTSPLVGFVVVFAGVQLVVLATARLIERVVDSLALSTVNRLAGSALGAFKAALILSVLFLVLGAMQMPGADTRGSSTLYEPVAGVLPQTWDAAASYLPAVKRVSDEFGGAVRPHLTPDAPSDDVTPDDNVPPPETTPPADSTDDQATTARVF